MSVARDESMLYTAEETAQRLRLDEGRDIELAVRALDRYRTRKLIRGCRVGKAYRYTEAAIQEFIRRREGVNGA